MKYYDYRIPFKSPYDSSVFAPDQPVMNLLLARRHISARESWFNCFSVERTKKE
jgi:hypothetical protein